TGGGGAAAAGTGRRGGGGRRAGGARRERGGGREGRAGRARGAPRAGAAPRRRAGGGGREGRGARGARAVPDPAPAPGQRQRHRGGAGPGGGGPRSTTVLARAAPAGAGRTAPAGAAGARPARAAGADAVLAGPVVILDPRHRGRAGGEARLDTALDRLEDPRDGRRGAGTVRGRLGQHHHHQAAQVGVDLLRQLWRLLLDLRHRDLHLARAGEGTPAVEHLVAHDAQRVDVREGGGLLAHRLLGGE